MDHSFSARSALAVPLLASAAFGIDWRVVHYEGRQFSDGSRLGMVSREPFASARGAFLAAADAWDVNGIRSRLTVVNGDSREGFAPYASTAPDPLRPAALSQLGCWFGPDLQGRPGYICGEFSPGRTGLYVGDGPGSLILRVGDRAPGAHQDEIVAEILYGSSSITLPTLRPGFAHDGTLFIAGRLAGSGVTSANDSCLWMHRAGTTTLLVREGSAEGAPGSQTIGSVEHLAAAAFDRAVVLGADRSVWAWDGGSFSPIALDNGSAPGIDERSRLLLSYSGPASMNGAGDVAFSAWVQLYQVPEAPRWAIWGGSPQTVAPVWNPRQSTSFIAPGVAIASFSSPLLSGAGSVAVIATLEGQGVTADNNSCLLIGRAGAWTLVAREGDQHATDESLFRIGQLRVPNFGIDRFDQIVFTTDDPVPALWLWEPDGGLRVIMRLGTRVPVPAQGTALVTNFRAALGSGGQDGRASGFSDDGRLAVYAMLDGSRSAIVTADIAPPCPADWNTDGGIDGADVHSFFAAWEAGEADANRDGGTDGADVETFVVAWERGGC